MSFMKTNEVLTSQLRRTGNFARLSAMLLLYIPLCHGQDASCKVVADAQILMARTPHHTYSTETRAGRTTLSEDISMPGGVFWGTDGVWHRSRTSMQELAKDAADSLKDLRDCRHVADEAVNGAPASKYSLHNPTSGGDESVWIGEANGLLLKSEARFEDRRISSRYEFSNIQAPAIVH
jgi:hypothetical protein